MTTPSPQKKRIVNIETPSGLTRVKRPGGTGPFVGVICAKGTADDGSGQRPDRLVGRVYDLATAPPGHPLDATGGLIPGAVEAVFNDPSDPTRWRIDVLDGAACEMNPQADNNQIAVWDLVGTIWNLKTQRFRGKCDTMTECEAEVGASKSRTAGAAAGAAGAAGLALALTPLQWVLSASDFTGGPYAVFNGRWLLTLRQAMDEACVWDNGGDGTAAPHVELRCDSPAATLWQLRLRHGELVLCYTRPAGEWQRLGANVVSAVVPDGQELRGAPRGLEVVPV